MIRIDTTINLLISSSRRGRRVYTEWPERVFAGLAASPPPVGHNGLKHAPRADGRMVHKAHYDVTISQGGGAESGLWECPFYRMPILSDMDLGPIFL